MASTDKTVPYGLNQWQEDDMPKMEDFNGDNQKVNDALSSLVEKTAFNAHANDPVEHVGPTERESWDAKADASNVLLRDETTAFTPTAPTHPVNKQYVDDVVDEIASQGVQFATEAEAIDGVASNKAMSPLTTKKVIDDRASTKADKSTAITATLTATAWSGTAAPFTQTVTVSGMVSTANGYLALAQSATAEQAEAARDALIRITAQGANAITVAADEDKPAIDIPITITIVG